MKCLLAHQKILYTLAKSGKLPAIVLLWWAMGAGKTIGGLLCTVCMGSSDRVLVLCEKSLLGQWNNVVNSFLKSAFCGDCRSVTVRHYQALTTDDVRPKSFDMCIVDESHIFRNAFKDENRPAELSRWIGYIMQCERIVYLTGTPIVSDAAVEMKGIEQMMRASTVPLDGRIFYYSPMDDERLSKNFAKTVMKRIECPMTYAQYFKYAADKKSIFELTVGEETYAIQRPGRNTYNTALIAASNNPFPITPQLSPKLMAMISMLKKGYDAHKRQLVYSQRLDTGINALLELWVDMYPATERNVFTISGSHTSEQRFATIRGFNRGCKTPIPRILFISDAAAHGVDLQEVEVVHLLEPGHRLQEERQVINRAVRFKSHKSKDTIVYVYLYCSVMTPGRAESGPLTESVRSIGMFDVEISDAFLTDVRHALDKHMRNEGMTIDEKLLVTRDQIDKDVQLALVRLKSHAYKTVEKTLLTQAAVMSAIRQALSNHIHSPQKRKQIDDDIHERVMRMGLVKSVKKMEKHGQRRQANGHVGTVKRDKGGPHTSVRRGKSAAKQAKKKGKAR